MDVRKSGVRPCPDFWTVSSINSSSVYFLGFEIRYDFCSGKFSRLRRDFLSYNLIVESTTFDEISAAGRKNTKSIPFLSDF